MKKTLSVCLTFLILLGSFVAPAAALPLSAGTDALNAQFPDGAYEDLFDFVYFSPVKGESDAVKYPLLVWLHGMNSGTEPRAQLQWYHFSNFASDEYQARFKDAGGCFLLAVRADDPIGGNNWDSSMCSRLKETIDRFIGEHAANVDPERIYIAGYSTGGSMAWDMAAKYGPFFAAVVPLASLYQPTASDLNNLKNVSVWVFCCDQDPYPLAQTAETEVTFEYLKSVSKRRSSIRMTRFSEAVFADGTKQYIAPGTLIDSKEHYIWESFTFDMHMIDGVTPYAYASTVNGNGSSVTFQDPEVGVISWLSAQRRYTSPNEPDTPSEPPYDPPEEPVEIPTATESFMRFVMMFIGYIKAFFEGLFGRFN